MTNLSIEEAKKEKWRLGQIKYGPEFIGHPLEQLDDELIDAMNYCDVASRWGYDVEFIHNLLKQLCLQARKIKNSKT